MARYIMVPPLRPQNVQWERSPHQQPREVSKVRDGWTLPSGKLRLRSSRKDS
jgi:hypothetical protein